MNNPLTCTCSGEFCNLIRVLDPDRDLILHTKAGCNDKRTLSKTDRDLQARERAYRLASKVLARSELNRLEDSGNLMRMRIPDRIDPCEMKFVSEDCIITSKREFRSTLLELSLAEEMRCPLKTEREEDIGKESNAFEYRSVSLSTISSSLEISNGMVAVCSICFHVYNLLHRARILLSYQPSTTFMNGEVTPGQHYISPEKKQDKHEKNQSDKESCLPKFTITKGGTVTSTSQPCAVQQTSPFTFTPQINGIADLFEDFETAKRMILEETSNLNINRQNREKSAAGFGTNPLQIKPTKMEDATENLPSANSTTKVKEPVQKNHSHRDNKRLSAGTTIDSVADADINIDQHFMTGIIHLDDSTSFPYRILGNGTKTANENMGRKPIYNIYNMIVCNDIFDNYERFTSIFMPFVMKYPSLQVLLWNYPGQAFTTYSTIPMDNMFFSECLHTLLRKVGESGTKEFDTTRQFYIMGAGCGGSVAALFASRFKENLLKAVLLVNPLLFVDAHYASVIHDCRNAFSCCPEARPDIPTYFFSRFLFSSEYLQRVSAPQALNTYTSEPNPITVKGRIKLCQTALNFVDVRQQIRSISRPIISIHGQSSYLVRPSQAAFLQEGRHLCDSIFQALRGKSDSTIIYMTKGGHEIIQEKREHLSVLIDQLLTSYHEMFEVIPSAHVFELRYQVPTDTNIFHKIIARKDFTDVRDVKGKKESVDTNHLTRSKIFSEQNEALRWDEYRKEVESREMLLHRPIKNCAHKKAEKNAHSHHVPTQETPISLTILDPHKPSFERHMNKVYRPGNSMIYPDPDICPRVKEMMGWRLKRNEQRLNRYNRAALVIQKAMRMHMAKTIIFRIRKDVAALLIQRCFRGMIGRKLSHEKRQELWAAKFVQRAYRGHLGRLKTYGRRMAIACQTRIARRWRGYKAKRIVQRIIHQRFNATIILQCYWRKYRARCSLKWMRLCHQSSTNIQRVFRGYLGRKKATLEREKYIFSLSQSNGIEMGRRLLAQHKLSATRLQSALNIIDQEKTSIKIKLEELRTELLSFEETVTELEREMHKICSFEREHPMAALGSGKFELKEKKIRLDQDFTLVLTRISDRKNLLQQLEEKLSALNLEREGKAGELKSLERKLVFLLEDQETALKEILTRQKKSGRDVEKIKGIETDDNRLKTNVSSCSIDRGNHQAAKLMESTENMMKFGFMSMSMTYFSSLNMIKALKSVAVQNPTISETTDNEEELRTIANVTNTPQKENRSKKLTLIDVDFWGVDQVVSWLHSIQLHQYEAAFREGSVDGPFLCQLKDEDLRFALGVEHKLHRKKILYYISKLSDSKSSPQLRFEEKQDPIEVLPSYSTAASDRSDPSKRNLYPSLHELCTWIKSHKSTSILEALKNLPDKRFDQSFLRVQYVEGVGTVYRDPYEREMFHLNKADDHGNTPLHIAAQNGDLRIAKILFDKGANPNHQNKQGQTPGHFAVAYQFFDFASWLFDERGGKANDLLANMYGLGPYDGLTTDGNINDLS